MAAKHAHLRPLKAPENCAPPAGERVIGKATERSTTTRAVMKVMVVKTWDSANVIRVTALRRLKLEG